MHIQEFHAKLTSENHGGALVGALRKLMSCASLETLQLDADPNAPDPGWGEWADGLSLANGSAA